MKGYDFTFEITAEMIHKLNLRTTHLLVFALLDHYTKKNGCCVLGCGAIADMLGMNKGFSPKFLRRYADLSTVITDAVGQYITDVKSNDFPNENESY